MTKINKTSFITVLSWILIILSGIGVLMSIIQNILINLMFDSSSQDGITHTSKGFIVFICQRSKSIVQTFKNKVV